MNRPAASTPPAAGSAPAEVRYSLKQMLAEVAAERQSGAFGQEKMDPADIRRAFKAKPRARR